MVINVRTPLQQNDYKIKLYYAMPALSLFWQEHAVYSSIKIILRHHLWRDYAMSSNSSKDLKKPHPSEMSTQCTEIHGASIHIPCFTAQALKWLVFSHIHLQESLCEMRVKIWVVFLTTSPETDSNFGTAAYTQYCTAKAGSRVRTSGSDCVRVEGVSTVHVSRVDVTCVTDDHSLTSTCPRKHGEAM